MNDERLQQILNGFSQLRIGILGDFFLDKYLEVDSRLAEPSVETGLTAHQVVAIRCMAGAAGTVVNNLAALGIGKLFAIGLRGDDGEGFELNRRLESVGCDTRRLFSDSRVSTPTYLKPRDANVPGLAGEHSRYDTRNFKPTPSDLVETIRQSVVELLPHLDALILLDQVDQANCGVLTKDMRAAAAEWAIAFPTVIFWADSRAFIREFREVMIKPNQFEVVGISHPKPNEQVDLAMLMAKAQELRDQLGRSVFCTLGADGMLVADQTTSIVPGVRVTPPIDTTGAGDSATAGAVATLACHATAEEAALIGNLVASITIKQLSTTGTATREQVAEQLTVWREQQRTR
jgi:bifunctional ADP-heptose synthase (sugar kinase/adenylyltransferase)